MDTRPRTSYEQYVTLLNFMESRGDLNKPQSGAQGRLRADRLWQELANTLNSLGSGVSRTPLKWKKVWTDWKTKTKKKAISLMRQRQGTGGGPHIGQPLSAYEERLLSLMGTIAVEGMTDIEECGFSRPPQVINEVENEISPPLLWTPPEPSPSTSQVPICPLPLVPPTQPARSAPPTPPAPQALPAPRARPAPPAPPAPPAQPAPRARLAPRALPASPALPATPAPLARSTPVPAPRRRQPPSVTSPPSSHASPSRHRQLTRQRRVQTPFERATSEFVAVEQGRLRLDELRERNETRRIEQFGECVESLRRLTDIADRWLNHCLSRDDTVQLNPEQYNSY